MATTPGKTAAGAGTGRGGSAPRRRDQIRARVLGAGIALAERGPFSELTIERIASAAGISRSAFYLHFRDKNDLLLAALEQVSSELRLVSDRWWRGSGPPAERVRRAVEEVVGVWAEHASLLRVASEVSTSDPDVREVWRGAVERLIEANVEHIRSEQEKGLVPRRLDAGGTGEALVWMLERCCYVYLGPGGREPAQVVDQLVGIWTATLYPGVVGAEELRPGAA